MMLEQIFNPRRGFNYIVFRQGIVVPRQRIPIWTVDKEGTRKKVFVNCFNCAKINKLDTRKIHKDGFFVGDGCFKCINRRCNAYLFPYLKDWPGSIWRVQVKKETP
jgi:hypothetical protein